MSSSKFILGGVFVVAAFVSMVPLFKRDFEAYSSQPPVVSNSKSGEIADTGTANNKFGLNKDIIGTYNGNVVSRNELTPQEKQSLYDAESQVYKAQENILAQKYFENVINQYAKDNKITDKNLAQQKFLHENIKIDNSDIKAFIQQNADNPQLKGKTYQEQEALVKPYMYQQAAGSFYRDNIEKAKDKGLIKVTGSTLPEMPSIVVNIDGAPSKGAVNAPITIVEFADFQCPYCYSAEATVQEVMKKYEGKVKFVFKNYPLVQLHPQAVNAAIATECAQSQGKFWEMHRELFENHQKLTDNIYASIAKNIKLDMPKFQACFKDENVKDRVMKEAEYGQSLGINATPAFYINGKLLMGAQPFSEFKNLIEKELNKNRG